MRPLRACPLFTLLLVACGPGLNGDGDASSGAGSESDCDKTAGTDCQAGTTGADGHGESTSSSSVTSGFDSSGGPVDGDGDGSSTGVPEEPWPGCPIPSRPNASITVDRPGAQRTFGYAWYGPSGGGECHDAFVVMFLPSPEVFVAGWETYQGISFPQVAFSEALGITTYETVAVEWPADGVLTDPELDDEIYAYGTTVWEEVTDPTGQRHLVGTLRIDDDPDFSAEGEYDALWCPSMSTPPCSD